MNWVWLRAKTVRLVRWPISIEAFPDLQPNTRLESGLAQQRWLAFRFMILLSVETLYILAVLRTLHLIPAVHLVQCSERQKDRASQISFNGRTVAFLQSCCTISNVPPMKRPRGLSFFVSHRLISPPAPDLLAERRGRTRSN